MKEVIVNAFPKSGVTWLLHLVCDLLEGQHQDTDKMKPLSYNHPITSDWIVRKNHYPYWEQAIPLLKGKTVVLTQRDPRDVVVSAMFYRKTTDLNAAIDVMIQSNYVGWLESWLKPVELLKVEKLIITSYERLHSHPYSELKAIISHLVTQPLAGPSDDRIQQAIDRQSFHNMTSQLGGDRHFMRKGKVGDWRNHFDKETAKRFNLHFGAFMLEQGYIDALDWWKDV